MALYIHTHVTRAYKIIEGNRLGSFNVRGISYFQLNVAIERIFRKLIKERDEFYFVQ